MKRTVDKLDVSVVEEDRVVGPVKARACISRGGPVLLSDKLLEELNIVILNPGKGFWCFADELGVKVRRSK